MAEEVDYDEDVGAGGGSMAVGDSREESGSGRSGRAKIKGRGHGSAHMDEQKYEGRGGIFERIGRDGTTGPLQCKCIRPIKIIVIVNVYVAL
jgi:hypothetical protein